MKRTALLLVVVAAVTLIALVVLRLAPWQVSKAPTSPETATLEQEITTTVRAFGKVMPAKQAALSFPLGGLLAEINVSVGERVQPGQQLARLDAKQVELNVAYAEASLKVSEARLRQLTTRPTLTEFVAERALEKAVQALREVAEKQRDVQGKQLAVATAELELAKLSLRNAQQDYERVAWRPDIGMLPEALALEHATAEYQRALANYNLVLAASEHASALYDAALQLMQAQLEVFQSRRTPTADEKEIAEGEVELAKLALEQAKLHWANTILTAPFSGTVTAINAQVGQVVSQAMPVLALADLDHYYIEAQVNEKDIGRVQVGQMALITLKAFPSTSFEGKVSAIIPLVAYTEGEASYAVKIEMPPSDMRILPGMTAIVDITVSAPTAEGLVTPTSIKPTRTPDPYQVTREHMVTFDIEQRGVRDPEVLRAMRTVPRHEFVLPEYVNRAYGDHPLPIGYGQTISQPYIVAVMTELLRLKRGDRVLEIGTGSGYQAAILAELTDEVYSVEIIEELYKRATETLNRLGYSKVKTKHADGYYGWEEYAPYDAIIVTCAPDHIPQPLINQLKDGGRLVIPVGPPGGYQTLWLIEKHGEKTVAKEIMGVVFVPLTGTHPTR